MNDPAGEYGWNLLSPPVWIVRAGDLLEAASALEREVRKIITEWDWDTNSELDSDTNGIVGVYFMLIGFALENLLKAKLIRLNRDTAYSEMQKKRKLPSFLKSHDLVPLAANAGFVARPEEVTILKLLTRAAVWDGRYPVPADVNGIRRTLDSDPSGRRVTFSELTIEEVSTLVARVRSVLDLRPPY